MNQFLTASRTSGKSDLRPAPGMRGELARVGTGLILLGSLSQAPALAPGLFQKAQPKPNFFLAA